jgi:hypothetical protein
MHSIVHAGTVALLLTLGQSNGQPFAGKWTCEYFGRTLARLDLQDVNGSVTGRMSMGVFHVDSDGKLDVVIEEATVFTPTCCRSQRTTTARRTGMSCAYLVILRSCRFC